MTRIIAGFAGSLSLAVPGSGTRPTSDRVREAIFSALDSRDLLAGASVLDLYAGSGALGLEAASRGASRVVLVERDARAAAACRTNAERVRAASVHPPVVEVVTRPVASFLKGPSGPWDVTFLDPPYDLGDDELAEDLSLVASMMAPGGVVLVERGSRSPEPRWPELLVFDRSKKHGDTTLWWARAAS